MSTGAVPPPDDRGPIERPSSSPGQRPPGTGLIVRSLARLIVGLRWLIIPAWVAAAVMATLRLPSLTQAQAQALTNLIPQDASALQVEARADRLFGVPVLARTVIVQRDPRGLSAQAQGRVVARAVELDRHAIPQLRDIPGAIPLLNTLRLVPGSKENGTTGLTYLFFRPDEGLFDQQVLTERFVRVELNRPDDHYVGVTGAAPARYEQGTLITEAMPWVEFATVLLITIILALTYRSIGAPLIVLAGAALAYLISVRIVAWTGQQLGVAVPQELEPLLVVLLLGIITDYSIFFITGMRNRLAAGDTGVQAARWTSAAVLPIVVTAGLAVTAGAGALTVARLHFLRSFGPGLAITVLVTLMVAITFVPAALGLLGRWTFWPTTPRLPKIEADVGRGMRTWQARMARLTTAKPFAALIALVSLAILVAASLGVVHMRLGFSLWGGLPEDNRTKQATEAATRGFAAGILSPTMILLEGDNLLARRPDLVRLQSLIGAVPGVSAVLGPAQLPADARTLGLAISKDGRAARYVVILRDDPLSGVGVGDVARLEERMPALVRQVGLTGVRASFAGDTALVRETIQRTISDLIRIGLVILAVDLILLAVLLRALVAPLYLLATSALALVASIGLTVLVFQGVMHQPDLTYYVPIAAAVLLVSLGSDYNIFVVGRIWEEARSSPLRDAIALGSRRATRAVTIAGLTLAASFGLLAIVPLTPFRELAFALGAGVVIDSFLVRSMLVPALISLFGHASTWPSRGFGKAAALPREEAAA